MQSFKTTPAHDPFEAETLENQWFADDKPTWKPPPRQSSRPPAEELGEDLEAWFV